MRVHTYKLLFLLQEIYEQIQLETQRQEHKTLGMFVLLLMSFGKRDNIILGSDYQPVDLVKVQDLLSPYNFPAMKGKPKLVIVQACSGCKLPYML